MAATPISMAPFSLAAVTFAAQFVQVAPMLNSQPYSSIPHLVDRRLRGTSVLDKVDDILAEDVEELRQLADAADAKSANQLEQLRQGRSAYGSESEAYGMPPSAMRDAALHVSNLQMDNTQGCPVGYVLTPGDVPGADAFGRGSYNVMDSILGCASDCNERTGCLSFEYSPSSRNCYLNKMRLPTAVFIGDTLFCSKVISFVQPQLTSANSTERKLSVPANDLAEDGSPNPDKAEATKDEKPKANWLTFKGRFSEAIGVVLWAIIGAVGFCFILLLLTCICQGLSALFFDNDYVEKEQSEEDRELHEVWVRSGQKK